MDSYLMFISSPNTTVDDFAAYMERNITAESLPELVHHAVNDTRWRDSSRDNFVSYTEDFVFLTPECLVRLFHENRHFGASVRYNIDVLLEDWKFIGFTGYDMRVNSILAPGGPSTRLRGWGEWTFRNDWMRFVRKLWWWRCSLPRH